MPNLFPGVNTWAANIRTPADGEAVNAAITDLPGSDAADRTLWLRSRMIGLQPAGYTLIISLAGGSEFDVATTYPVWTFNGNTNWTQQSDNGLLNFTWFPVPKLLGVNVTGATFRVRGAGGHAGMPGVRPIGSLAKKAGYGVPTILGTATDPTVAVPAYQANHNITFALGAPSTMEDDLYLFFNGEGGANFVAGLEIYEILLTLMPI